MSELPDLTSALSLRDRAAFALMDQENEEKEIRNRRFDELVDATTDALTDILGIPWNGQPEFQRVDGTAYCDFIEFEVEGLSLRSKGVKDDRMSAVLEVRTRAFGSSPTWKIFRSLAELAKIIKDCNL